MGRTPNSGRANNKDSYRKRDDMKGQGEVLGEDISGFGQGKGAYRKRLANEIEDNSYEANTDFEVSDDPKGWGEDLQLGFIDSLEKNYKKSLKKYEKIIKKTYAWMRSGDELGTQVTSLVEVRAAIAMRRVTWEKAEENSEEFAYYAGLIRELCGARIHHLGVTDSKGQVFKIFSIKTHLPDEFKDTPTVKRERIEVIQIQGGSEQDVKDAIAQGKKRLKE